MFNWRAAFSSPVLLEDAKWSLLKVYRYGRAHRHFSLPYTALDQIDYHTLESGRLFVARTAFALFYNALPRAGRRRFALDLVATIEDRAQAPYGRLWASLRTLVGEYASFGRLFGGIREVLQDLARSQPDVHRELTAYGGPFVGNPDAKLLAADSLSEQGRRFDELRSALAADGSSLEDALESEMALNAETERRFEEAFRGRAWPVEEEL